MIRICKYKITSVIYWGNTVCLDVQYLAIFGGWEKGLRLRHPLQVQGKQYSF